MGKTSFASSVLLESAINFLTHTAYITLSLSQEILLKRLLSSKAKIKSEALNSGKLTDNQLEKVRACTDELTNKPIYISDRPDWSFYQLEKTIKPKIVNRRYF